MSPPSRCRGDAGSATVLLLALSAVLAVAAAAVLALGAAGVARARAESAADLAALAAAAALQEGADACTRAAEVAAAPGVRLEECVPDGETVRVAVSAAPAGRLALLGRASALAEAGPGPALTGGPG